MPNIAEQPTPVRLFLEQLQKWIATIDREGLPEADARSEEMRAAGKLLAFDPEFKRIFNQHMDRCQDSDPEDVLECIYAFFKAINDAALSGTYRKRI